MTDQLKPCPFCGESPIFYEKDNWNGTKYTIQCPRSDMMVQAVAFVCDDKKSSIEFWNSAFCWRELEKLQSKIELGKKLIGELVEALDQIDHELGRPAGLPIAAPIQNASIICQKALAQYRVGEKFL